jgi:hypothetical protein
MSYFVYLETILNDRAKSYLSDDDDGYYINVLSLDRCPEGNIRNYIKTINTPKLSTFKGYERDRCKHVFCDKETNYYFKERDIPRLFSLLAQEGYRIDDTVSKIMFKNKACSRSDRKFMFSFSCGNTAIPS